MTSATISPNDARRRLEDGSAILVDIREPAEHARENIPGASLAPLSRFDAAAVRRDAGHRPAVIFHCQGGNRTRANAQTLEACGTPEVYMLEGGLQGWKAAGLPTRLDRSQPIEMQRQVQIAAGTLVVTGLALGAAVSPWFILLSAFVGCGLVFAGVSGWCGMAKLLAAMPWNRAAA
jgi:rhodanese-related sulfurtransferase